MTTLSETLRHLSPPDRVRAQIERLSDSDAVTLDKVDARALLAELTRLRRLEAAVASWAHGPASRLATNQERALMRGILETTDDED